MVSRRQVRVNEILRREISAGLYEVLTGSAVDLARVTITGVEVSSDLRQALVHVSVMSEHAERQEHVLDVLRRRRSDLQAIMSRNLKLKYTPHLRFRIDRSMAEADRVLRLISELEGGQDGSEAPEEHDDERSP